MKKKKFLWLGLSASSLVLPVAVACGGGSTTSVGNQEITPGNETGLPKPPADDKYNTAFAYPSKQIDTQKYQSTDTLLGIINPPAKTINLDGKTSFSQQASSGLYTVKYDSTHSDSRNFYDLSFTTGGLTESTYDSEIPRLVELNFYGRPEVTETSVQDTNTLETIKTRTIHKPSVSRYSLELADVVILTVKQDDGTTKDMVFDQDDAPLLPKPDKPDGSYSLSLVELQSDNPRSINSDTFRHALKKATKMSFRIRKNQKWINSKGEVTKYPIKAEDFWMGVLRTYAGQDSLFRLNNGGTEEIEKLAREKYVVNGDLYFRAQGNSWTNKYLYELYNIDVNKILDKTQSVHVEGTGDDQREFFVLQELDPKKESKFDLAYDKFFFNSYDLIPAPSQYIEETVASKQLPNFYKSGDISDSDKTDIKNKINNLQDGLAKESGIYWYGMSMDSALYAGKYYYAGYDGTSLTDTFKLNTNYWNQKFVNNPRRVKLFQNTYTTTPLGDGFAKFNYEQFKAGLTASANYSNLKAYHEEISANPVQWGLIDVQSRNTSHSNNGFTPTWIPQNQQESTTASFMNDAYTKLVYGASLTDIKAGTATNTLKAATTGLGAEFMNILTASINWAYVAQELLTPNLTIPWISGFAQDVTIRNNDSDTSLQYNTLRPYWDQLSTVFVVDSKTGQKVNLGEKIGTELSPSENSIVGKTADDQFSSSALDILKTKMKEVLDEFYKQHPDLDKVEDTKKVRFTVRARFTNINSVHENVYKGMQKVLNSLYPDRFEVKFEKNNNRKDFDEFFNFGSTPYTVTGWGYDYNLVGSGFDGYMFQGNLIQLFTWINTDADYKAKLQVNYPNLVKAAEYWKKFIEDPKNNVKFSIPLEKLIKLGNKYTNDISTYLNQYQLKTVDGKEQLVPLSKEDVAKYLPPLTISANFWLWLNTSDETKDVFNKKALLNMVAEFRNLTGMNMTITTGTLKDSFVKGLSNPNFIIPATLDNATNYGSYEVATK
ncbi:OppA family ABC transporter substrate-binding lipoprotein [Mycoplasma sp. AC1221]